MKCRAGLLATALSLWAAAASAQGEDPPPLEPTESRSAVDEGTQQRARIHFQAGASYYEAGAYEDALREWSRAYALSQRPELLYNLSLAHQGLNHLEEALDHLRRFLAEVPDVPNRANLELRVQNLERRIAEARPPEPTPAEDSPREPEPTPAPPEPASSYVSPGAIAGFAIGGAGLVSSAIFGALTLAEDSRLKSACATPCGEGAASDLRTFALVTDISLGVMLAGAAVGVIFLLVDPGRAESVAALPWLGPDGGGVVARGRF